MFSLKMEAFGDSYVHYRRRLEEGVIYHPILRDVINAIRWGGREMTPWVARLSWGKQQPQRTFLNGQRDYMNADRWGNRGIFVYFYLPPGIYEINHPLALGKSRRYYAIVKDDDLIEITQVEALAWLKSGI